MQVNEKEVERRVKRFTEAARAAGVKLTHQRLEIFRVLAGSIDHPSAEAVHSALSPRMPTLSQDTVYRTLRLLSDLGLVTTLGTKRESVRFDANPVPHHHFICVRCGLARDFISPELDTLAMPESVSEFGSVDTTHVEVRGICHKCREKDPAER